MDALLKMQLLSRTLPYADFIFANWTRQLHRKKKTFHRCCCIFLWPYQNSLSVYERGRRRLLPRKITLPVMSELQFQYFGPFYCLPAFIVHRKFQPRARGKNEGNTQEKTFLPTMAEEGKERYSHERERERERERSNHSSLWSVFALVEEMLLCVQEKRAVLFANPSLALFSPHRQKRK